MCYIFLSINSKNPKNIIRKFFKLTESTKSVDGYGIAYIKNNKWNVYKKPFQYIKDKNFSEKIKKMDGPIYIAHVREVYRNVSKKKLLEHSAVQNTHPFTYKNYIFAQRGNLYINHNNQLLLHQIYINNPKFVKIINSLKKFIEPGLKKKIKGITDSEVLFFLFLSIYNLFKKKYDCGEERLLLLSFYKILHLLQKYKIEHNSNIVFSNGKFIIAANIYHTNNPDIILPINFYMDNTNGLIFSCIKCTNNSVLIERNTIHIINIESKSCNKYPFFK